VVELVGGKVSSPPFLKDGSGITYGPVEGVSPGGSIIHEMLKK
jgi:hypothetical protein